LKTIKYIKDSCSINHKITYWAKVGEKLKRISQECFLILKNKGIEIVVKSINMVKKKRCLSLTKKGFQCSRLTFVTDNCYQHKNHLILDKTCHSTAQKFAQFYTTANNAAVCMRIYKKFISIDKEKDIIIEPSAGCGSFIKGINKLCNTVILLDIDPKHKDIQKGDFLGFNKNLDKFKKVHIIGNPPFNIVTKFIKKASNFANVIGFILPLSFVKESRKKVFPFNFHCVHEHVLLNNDFYFNNNVKKIPTVFQIWEKREFIRDLPVKLISNYIQFVKKKDLPTLAFRRVGFKCGEISTEIETKSESSHYFIKLNGLSKFKFFEVYKKIKFSKNNTVAQKSISQQELLFELKKYGI
jgi:hypothetical protein